MTPAVFTLLFYSFLLRDLLSTYYVQSTVDVMGKKIFPLLSWSLQSSERHRFYLSNSPDKYNSNLLKRDQEKKKKYWEL